VKRYWIVLVLACCLSALAAELLPPSPAQYFNDYAKVVSSATASQLNQTLEGFERQSSEQIVVAVFPRMQSDSSIEDYTIRVFRSWAVGQKAKNNGAALFVFVQDRKMFLQVGYGLEGVLPDALCKRIIEEQIAPRFKTGDYGGGLSAGVQSIIAAARGEYNGTGATVADSRTSNGSGGSLISIIVVVLVIIFAIFSRGSGMFLPWLLLAGSGSTRGWGGGGGSSGGGGFSGGGGSGGGGGAGGSW
jgi:uncharacterized protein